MKHDAIIVAEHLIVLNGRTQRRMISSESEM